MKALMALYRMAEQENITVDCFKLGKREALSMMDRDGQCHIAIDPFKLESVVDEKMKLLHEMGHCVTGSFYNQYALCDDQQRHENTATRWAIEHLIPAEALDRAVAAGHTELWDLAEHFGVSEAFMKKAICWYTQGNLAVEQYFD
jgi:hypothetical protein